MPIEQTTRSDSVSQGDVEEALSAALAELDRECRCAAARGEDGTRVGLAVLRKHFGPALLLAREEFAPLTNSALRAAIVALEQGGVTLEAVQP